MVPISSDSQDVTGQTVNYFFPVLKDAGNNNQFHGVTSNPKVSGLPWREHDVVRWIEGVAVQVSDFERPTRQTFGISETDHAHQRLCD
jgi:hypothetical protein